MPASAYFNKALVKFHSPIVIEKPGYIYVYLICPPKRFAKEELREREQQLCLFRLPAVALRRQDDFKVNYQKSQIVQSNNYYAFGLQTSDSWTRIDTKPNQYLYNSGSELNNNTNWYETPLRGYDATIGRFNGVDILASATASLTPYQYANNDPVYWSDPTGAIADDTPWSIDRGMRGKYDGYDSFADFAFQNWNTHQGGFNTYENFYGSGWNNQMNNGSSFENYGVATGWSDAMANAIIQNVQDAKSGDAQALQDYGARNGTSFGGGLQGLTSAMFALNAVNYGSYGAGSFSYQFGSRTYGGTYHTTDGAVTSAAVQQVMGSFTGNGGLVGVGAWEIYEFNGATQGNGSLWISSGQNSLEIFGGLAGAAGGVVVSGDYWLGENGKYYSKDWGGNQHTGARSGAYKAAAGYRTLGRVAVASTVVLGGIEVYNGYQADGGRFGYNAQYATASTTGGLVGGWAGAEGGAAVGAAIGVWFGGIGAVPGAVIGGLIGGIAGGLLGSSIGESSVNYYHGR